MLKKGVVLCYRCKKPSIVRDCHSTGLKLCKTCCERTQQEVKPCYYNCPYKGEQPSYDRIEELNGKIWLLGELCLWIEDAIYLTLSNANVVVDGYIVDALLSIRSKFCQIGVPNRPPLSLQKPLPTQIQKMLKKYQQDDSFSSTYQEYLNDIIKEEGDSIRDKENRSYSIIAEQLYWHLLPIKRLHNKGEFIVKCIDIIVEKIRIISGGHYYNRQYVKHLRHYLYPCFLSQISKTEFPRVDEAILKQYIKHLYNEFCQAKENKREKQDN